MLTLIVQTLNTGHLYRKACSVVQMVHSSVQNILLHPVGESVTIWLSTGQVKLDKAVIQSFKPSKLLGRARIISLYEYGGGVSSNHDTKASPCYYSDFLGDYREKVIYRANGNKSLSIYFQPIIRLIIVFPI